MPIDLRKFLEGLKFSVTKPKEVISSNINLKIDVGVWSSLLIPLYRVSLYFLDFTEFVSYGQFSSITVNSSLISAAKIIIIIIIMIMVIIINRLFQPGNFYAGSTTAIGPSAL